MLLIVVTAVYLLYVLVHDWAPLFPLNDMERQREQRLRLRLLVELGNVLPIAVLVVLAILYPDGRLPLGAAIYGGAYIVIFAMLAWLSWYAPYLLGSTAEREAAAEHEYGRTTQVLPRRGTRIRPNLMHVVLHALFLVMAGVLISRIVIG
jgi:hypothetical protein